MKKTKEDQYNILLDNEDKNGKVLFGLMSSFVYQHDPKRLTFLLSRYKFVSKMFSGFSDVMEIGCADAFGTRLVAEEVSSLLAIDFDPILIENARNTRNETTNIEYKVRDILKDTEDKKFDGIYSLDVLEHISKDDEVLYMTNLINLLKINGVAIIGMPSLESQKYASEASKIGHVNCKSGEEFKSFCLQYFHNVFLFSMNDEVVHTGYSPMAHYLFVLCTNPKVVKNG